MRPLIVHGAYGRFYMDAQEVLVDWWGGKDFKIAKEDGPYLSVRDRVRLVRNKYTHVQFIDPGTQEILAMVFIGELD